MKIYSSTVTGSLDITGSLSLNGQSVPTGTIPTTGSFLITASSTNDTLTFTKGDASTFNATINNVTQSISASYATSALSASYATSTLSSSYAANAGTATSASYAITASYALNGGGGGGYLFSSDPFWAFTNFSSSYTFAMADSAAVQNYYATASGFHLITTPLSNTGNINVRIDTSLLNDNEFIQFAFYGPNGSGTQVNYRTIINNPGNLNVWAQNASPSNIGSASTAITRGSLTQGPFRIYNIGALANPNTFLKKNNNVFCWYESTGTSAYSGPATGSTIGTPL